MALYTLYNPWMCHGYIVLSNCPMFGSTKTWLCIHCTIHGCVMVLSNCPTFGQCYIGVYIVQSMDVLWIHCIVKLPYIWTVLYRCVHCTIHGCVMDTLYCRRLDSAKTRVIYGSGYIVLLNCLDTVHFVLMDGTETLTPIVHCKTVCGNLGHHSQLTVSIREMTL